MKTCKTLLAILLLHLVLLPAGCARNPTVAQVRTNESYEGLRYEKVLVVAAAGKITFRNLFEGELANQMRPLETEVVPAFEILPYNNKLSRETVKKSDGKTDIEGILIVSLAEAGQQGAVAALDADNPYAYYERLLKTVIASGKTRPQDEQVLFLQANFYDAKSEKLIWSLSSESEFHYHMKSIAGAATLVIKHLVATGLL